MKRMQNKLGARVGQADTFIYIALQQRISVVFYHAQTVQEIQKIFSAKKNLFNEKIKQLTA